MLAVLFVSGAQVLKSSPVETAKTETETTAETWTKVETETQTQTQTTTTTTTETRTASLIHRLALPQLVLAALAATTFHVQIVNRIASGYPLWYIFLAGLIASSPLSLGPAQPFAPPPSSSPGWDWKRLAVRGMVSYALIQAVLYSAFLPPA
jgi:hypothetical protein